MAKFQKNESTPKKRGSQDLISKPPRDVDSETTKPRLSTILKNKKPSSKYPKNPQEPDVSDSESDSNENSNIKKPVRQELSGPFDVTMASSIQSTILLPVTFPTPATFVPSSILLFRVLHEMELIVSIDKRWASHNARWNPIASRLFYGVLFYVQIFRCMSRAQNSLSCYVKFSIGFPRHNSFE
jgi:hypothetical protein